VSVRVIRQRTPGTAWPKISDTQIALGVYRMEKPESKGE